MSSRPAKRRRFATLDAAVVTAFRRNYPRAWKNRMRRAVDDRRLPPGMHSAILRQWDRLTATTRPQHRS